MDSLGCKERVLDTNCRFLVEDELNFKEDMNKILVVTQAWVKYGLIRWRFMSKYIY